MNDQYILNQPIWRIEIYTVRKGRNPEEYLADISDIYTTDLSVKKQRNYPDEIHFTVDLEQLQQEAARIKRDAREILEPYRHSIKLFRNNIFYTQAIVQKVSVSLNNDAKNTVEVSCTDIFGVLNKRLIHQDYTGATWAHFAVQAVMDAQHEPNRIFNYSFEGDGTGIENAWFKGWKFKLGEDAAQDYPEWEPNKKYIMYDTCTYGGRFWEAKKDAFYSGEEFDESNWQLLGWIRGEEEESIDPIYAVWREDDTTPGPTGTAGGGWGGTSSCHMTAKTYQIDNGRIQSINMKGSSISTTLVAPYDGIKNRLADGITRLADIVWMDPAVFDTEDYIVGENSNYEFTFFNLRGLTNDGTVLAAAYGPVSDPNGLMIWIQNWHLYFQNYETGPTHDLGELEDMQWYTLQKQGNLLALLKNGEIENEITITNRHGAEGVSLAISSVNGNGTLIPNTDGAFLINEVKLWQDDTLVHHYVGAVKDNNPADLGLYDIVTSTYHRIPYSACLIGPDEEIVPLHVEFHAKDGFWDAGQKPFAKFNGETETEFAFLVQKNGDSYTGQCAVRMRTPTPWYEEFQNRQTVTIYQSFNGTSGTSSTTTFQPGQLKFEKHSEEWQILTEPITITSPSATQGVTITLTSSELVPSSPKTVTDTINNITPSFYLFAEGKNGEKIWEVYDEDFYVSDGNWKTITTDIDIIETIYRIGICILSGEMLVDTPVAYQRPEDGDEWDLNIRPGDFPTQEEITQAGWVTNRFTPQYEWKTASEVIQDLSNMDSDNFWFWVDRDYKFNVSANAGSDEVKLELSYPKNITSMTVDTNASDLVNYLKADGSADVKQDPTVSGVKNSNAQSLTWIGYNKESMENYWALASAESFDSERTIEMLQNDIDAELQTYSNMLDVPHITVSNGAINPTDVQLGDIVVVQALNIPYVQRVSGIYKIIGIDVSVSADGVETVSLTLIVPTSNQINSLALPQLIKNLIRRVKRG